MPICTTPSLASTIAVVGLGPTAQALLGPLRERHLPCVQLLVADAFTCAPSLPNIGLLILAMQQASDADSQAMLALVQQVQDHGQTLPTLCVVVQPTHGMPDKSKTLAHYARQALQAQVDATVLLPADTDIDLPAWLAQMVADLAQSLGGSASIGFDMEDIARLLRGAGAATWISAQASGPDKALAAVHKLLAHPRLAGLVPQSVRQAAVWVSAASQTFKLSEARDILRTLQPSMHPDATQIFSVLHDANLLIRPNEV